MVLHRLSLEQIVMSNDTRHAHRREFRPVRKAEAGMTLVELLIAMLILAIGLGGLTNVLVVAMDTNNRNSKDTSATLLAQMVIEQMSAQHPNSNAPISVTDCAGNAWTIATTGGASPNGAGAALVTGSTSAGYGGIDQTQAYANITTNYAMKYVDCGGTGNTGIPTTYDVRWNVMTINANYTRMITVSARPLSAHSLGALQFAMPVSLRLVAGP
jgi:prepilin-type N-terminal cleavage/methylation domain-containing protein